MLHFMRVMAVNRQCCICHCRYLAVVEGVNPGICGACLSVAFPSPPPSRSGDRI